MRKFVFLLGFVFSGCYYHNNIEGSSWSYLPLEVGNSWDFVALNHQGISSELLAHREVVDVLSSDSDRLQYYLLVTHYTTLSTAYPIPPDSAYYRIDANGFVYIRRSDQTPEGNRFRLNANNGDNWTFYTNAKITVSLGSLQVGNTEIKNCKSYYLAAPADGQNTIWLAPGIGFAKEYNNAWSLGQILKSAKIHGHVYNF